jgi:intracellular multiplication protein IcmE
MSDNLENNEQNDGSGGADTTDQHTREGFTPRSGSRQEEKKSMFARALQDRSSKRLFIFMGAAIVFTLGVFLWPTSHKKQVSSVQTAPTLDVPQGSAVPSPAYHNALQQADQQRFKNAEKNGTSSIPTIEISGNGNSSNTPQTKPTGYSKSPNGYPSAPVSKNTQTASGPKLPSQPVLPAGNDNRAAPHHTNAPNVEVADQNRVQAIQQYMQKLDAGPDRAKLVAFPKNENVASGNNSGMNNSGNIQHNRAMTGSNQNASNDTQPVETAQIKKGPYKVPAPGTMLYSQLQIGANSDAPGPVMATIMQGPLAGARVLGSFQTSQNGAEIHFSTMTIPYKDSNGDRKTETLGIDAVAISPTRLDDNMATSVNDHLALRLAVAFGTSLLSNFGQLLAESGASTVINPTGAIATTNPTLNTTQQFESAGGQAAGTAGQIFNQEYGNMPPTIKVASGTPFALLFLGSNNAN